jgi:peroxiredoxin
MQTIANPVATATADRSFQLGPKLEKLRDFWGRRLSAADGALMEKHIEFLRQSGAMNNILQVGDTAPEFQLQNQHGQMISSAELLQKGPLVVSFYRGSWCPYCVEEVKVLNNVYEQIKSAGADLVVISPQSPARTEKQAAEIHLQYNMLVDKDNGVGKAFGLVYQFPDYLKDLYLQRFGNDIQLINEGTAWELPIPARFVIGSNGTILDVQSDPDYRYRPEPLATVDFLSNL